MAKPGRPKVADKVISYMIYIRQSTVMRVEQAAKLAGITRSKMTRKILEEGTQ